MYPVQCIEISKSLSCHQGSLTLTSSEFSTPAKPAGHTVENHARLSTWFHNLVTKVNTQAEQVGYTGEIGALAEFFLILSIHFHFEEKNELESVIKRELPVSPAIKSLTIQRLKERENHYFKLISVFKC